MFDFYQEKPAIRRREVVIPKFVYAKNGISENLLRRVTFYRQNPMAVRSNHLLVRLLQSISVSKYMEDRRYVDLVDDMSLNLAMHLKLTSPTHRGEAIENGPFYGRDSTEVILAHNEDFEVDKASKYWKKLQPIRFLMHPKSDIHLDLPDGSPNGSETGLSVIELNIPMLAFQYKKWWEKELEERPENPRTVMQFIHMFPIPNMLYSQIDIAIFNRFYKRLNGVEPLDSKVRHPHFFIDYEDRIDESIRLLIPQLMRKRMKFEGMLHSLFTIHHDDMFDVVRLPDIPRTRQVIWALTIARIPYFAYLLDMNEQTNSQANRSELNDLRRWALRLKMDRDIDAALPRHLATEVKKRLKFDIEAYL